MKIAVLVDLELSDKSGGHVKYWQRICESLKLINNEIDQMDEVEDKDKMKQVIRDLYLESISL